MSTPKTETEEEEDDYNYIPVFASGDVVTFRTKHKHDMQLWAWPILSKSVMDTFIANGKVQWDENNFDYVRGVDVDPNYLFLVAEIGHHIEPYIFLIYEEKIIMGFIQHFEKVKP